MLCYIFFICIIFFLFICNFTEAQLVNVYRDILPDKCCPLFRLEEALFIPKELIDLYLRPEFTVQEYRDGEQVTNSSLTGLTSIVEVTERAEAGMRIIVLGSGGLGKSAFSSHSTRLWCHGTAFNKYKLLYLLLPRYIHRHAEPLERIICTDLKLHNPAAEVQLRRAIKYNDQKMMFVIDGYDEVDEKEQQKSSLNKVISGEMAKQSTVVITSRPHCKNSIIKWCKGRYVLVTLEGLTTSSSMEYIERMCVKEHGTEAKKEAALQIMAHIPKEARHVPLLLNMAVLIYMWNSRHPAEDILCPRTRTVTDVIGRVIAMFFAIAEEKKGRDALPVCILSKLPNNPTVNCFNRMCYESIKTRDFVFTTDILHRFGFYESKTLSELGFLEILKVVNNRVESARCLHNQLLEYCAACHITKNPDDLKCIINKYALPNNASGILAEGLGFWQDTLIFSAGISSKTLSTISKSYFKLRVTCDQIEPDHQCLDLSYEARLIHETESPEAREEFCQSLMKAPLHVTTSVEVM